MSLTKQEIYEKFAISPKVGFLLDDPLTQLPEEFAAWHKLSDDLPDLIASGTVRSSVHRLPLLDPKHLTEYKQLRLAHLLLSTIAAGYVWCEGEQGVLPSLPRQLSIPFDSISERLDGLPAICNHSSMCLANYAPLMETNNNKTSNDPRRASDIRLISGRFTRNYGNDWFFLITCQIEMDFAPALEACVDLVIATSSLKADRSDANLTYSNLIDKLQIIHDCIGRMRHTLSEMRTNLSGKVFYNDVRPFLAGYTHGLFEQWGGLRFEDAPNTEPRPYTGGSAAQSCTIQCLDALLGIEHSGSDRDFLQAQRQYMLRQHRQLLDWIAETSGLKHLLQHSMPGSELHRVYSMCVDELRGFRSDHVTTATKYILLPKSQHKDGKHTVLSEIGTGGTGFMQFLKKVRDDTTTTTVSSD